MATVEELKAQLIHAAYVGACAVCEPLISNPDGTQLKLDALIQDVGLQQKGVLVYEEAKVQYAAILRAFHDKTGIWPDPVLPGGSQPSKPTTPAPAPPPPGSELGTLAQTVASVVAPVVAAAVK
jgi:hypothetical protein